MQFVRLAALVAVSAIAGAASASVTLSFPQDSSSYFSATNGSGTIGGTGGATQYMWTTGDYVEDSYAATGLASANRIFGSFDIENVLGGSLDPLLVDVVVNGTLFGTVSIPQCNFCFTRQTYSFDFTNGWVAGDDYTIRYELATTRASGDGSIRFFGGSRVTLEGGVIPEPATWAMMIAGFGLVGAAIRRRQPAVA